MQLLSVRDTDIGEDDEANDDSEYTDKQRNQALLVGHKLFHVLNYRVKSMLCTELNVRYIRYIIDNLLSLCYNIRIMSEKPSQETQELLHHQATHDELTGLLNKRGFEEELRKLETTSPGEFGLMVIDLDGMKEINDRRAMKPAMNYSKVLPTLSDVRFVAIGQAIKMTYYPKRTLATLPRESATVATSLRYCS